LDKGGASAKVWLAPVRLASNAGFAARDLSAILKLVRVLEPKLLEAWREFFGAL
jgi:hypothetical protein